MRTEAVIHTGKTPIFVIPMRSGSWLLTQGTSRLYISPAELDALVKHVNGQATRAVTRERRN